MKKNIIRLTEAELKQYISKVVAEQTAPAAEAVNVEAEKQKMTGLRAKVVGKNVQLYLDLAKTKKTHIVNIATAGFSSSVTGVYYFTTKDLSFVTSTGGQAEPGDNMGSITYLRFDCKEPEVLLAHGEGNKILGRVFCPPFTELVNESVACATINRTPDFASVKPAKPAAVAPVADIA
jgi:hypothetical protein